MSALDTEDASELDEVEHWRPCDFPPSSVDTLSSRPTQLSMQGIGKDLSDALDAAVTTHDNFHLSDTFCVVSPVRDIRDSFPKIIPSPPSQPQSTLYASPLDLAAELHSHPQLAALRARPSCITGISAPKSVVSPPILMDPICSGYFVEPMKWMEPFLESGQLAGKIICPKCGVKLGNYDWGGVHCNCRQWVTPGFCIHRSKVDEVLA